jgi:regulator of replication initiation timing
MDEVERVYQQLDRIEKTLERVVPELSAIKADLAYHIKRTDLLEIQVDQLDKNYTRFQGFVSIGGWLVATILTVATILRLFKTP